MKKIVVSSPGKLMLFGEHAVVYDRHCLVAAINERLKISMEKIPEKKLVVDLDSVHHEVKIEDINLNHLHEIFKFIDAIAYNFNAKFKIRKGIKIKVLKHFSSDYGFGSSAAITAAVTKGFFALFEKKHTDRDLFDLGYKSILDVQRVGSGFDLAASLFGEIVFFKTAGKEIKKIDKNLDFITCYTGIKASTAKIVIELKEKIKKNQAQFNEYFDDIEKIVVAAEKELIGKNYPKFLGKLMNDNQEILRKIGVSSERIDLLLKVAMENGAYGGKISGAGVGDCIIILAAPDKRKIIEKELEKNGGKVLSVKIDRLGTVIK